ncbi:MAG: glycosyl hydrolase [Myxococcales bacterium]|nr:glycosyl hydrolase [Myxococcales bacterium]MCB9520773.1 glycosyl hydrolase [Myxococcales bacterium]MCB9533490.1 glycosyl hydrolase [Myxococcales bacterium]
MSTVLVGTRKGLFIYANDGEAWRCDRVAHLGVPVPYAVRDRRTGTIWASLDHGHWGVKLSRSTDDGVTWEEVAAPTFPEGSELRDGEPATVKYLWVITPGPEDRPGRLYIGTDPGGLFRTDDDGATWQLEEALWNLPHRKGWFGGGRDEAGIHSVVIDPRDSRRILVAVSCAGVFETLDEGATWRSRNVGLKADFLPDPSAEIGQDPHIVVPGRGDFDTMWQQNHCGVYVSTDGAATWKEVSESDGPAKFGFVVAVDDDDPLTAWLVPADSDGCRVAHGCALSVLRTTDGGQTWTRHTDGLPTPAYDIAYRHALDNRGSTLVFGTTTGNLYASSDRGDTWACLSTNLPMVYSVRFA